MLVLELNTTPSPENITLPPNPEYPFLETCFVQLIRISFAIEVLCAALSSKPRLHNLWDQCRNFSVGNINLSISVHEQIKIPQ
jgi:hypothetical protein